MRHPLTIFFYVGIALVVTACASPARIEEMSVAGQPSQRIAATPLRNNLAIKDVTGGTDTNPMWKSNIGSIEFERALEGSLRAVGLLSPAQSGRFILTAHLEKVDQPLVGFSMTVTASVRYIVTERSTGKDLFNKVISVPYTAAMSDAFLGTERLRLANEGAVRVNITQLIDELFALQIPSVSVQ